nr:MAG TPA: hypothetical protein [Caudoviricetes sp.]DAS40638.1 MAG TPA: hypothetical protein [Caudoviricetes sp.]DAW70712.1 MAG TPA: hypothetical protein [Caudoviricetes sp.]
MTKSIFIHRKLLSSFTRCGNTCNYIIEERENQATDK